MHSVYINRDFVIDKESIDKLTSDDVVVGEGEYWTKFLENNQNVIEITTVYIIPNMNIDGDITSF